MRRLFIVLLFMVVLTGCVSLTIKPEKLSTIKKVSVVSLLGNDLCTRYVGTTVFTNKRASSDVTKWKIDETVQQIIGEAISTDGLFTYVDINIDYDSMMKIYGSEKAGCTKVGYEVYRIKDEIEDIRTRYDIDTLILVVEAWATSDYITGRSGLLFGYGLHQSSFLGMTDTVTHIFADVIVADTSNLETLAGSSTVSHEKIGKEYWNVDFEKLSPDKKQFIEQSIKKQLRSKLTAILKRMNLIR